MSCDTQNLVGMISILDDYDRPLSKRGKKNAKKICEFFVKKKI